MNSIGLRQFSVVRRTAFRMSSTGSSYEEAIHKLNSLQSNKASIEQIKRNIKSGQEKCTNIQKMENYLKRVGIPLSKLDELSVIHVAGTKGKGSTSAMCESILRRHGLHTGFYSSPHLVEARERLRLGGRPLSRAHFARHLHAIYQLLWDSQEFEGDMPNYFSFLTVVAFHVFLSQRVDVAVVEVGIGGIVDYTNVLRKVPVVGITALGLDHTSILGSTLPEIAAAKAGVMKRGCDAYSVRQPAAAHAVLAAYADRVKCPLTIVPDYSSYTFPDKDQCYLPVDIDAYRTNASLAIQLAHAWIRANTVHKSITNGLNTLHGMNATDKNNGVTNGVKNEEFNTNIPNNIHDIKKSYTNKETYLESKITNGIHTNKIQNGLNDKIANGTRVHQNGANGEIANGGHKSTKQDMSIGGITNGRVGIQDGANGEIANGGRSNQRLNGLTESSLVNGNTMGRLVFSVPLETAEGLRGCRWPGRYQLVEREYARFNLDGAHTAESMEICARWFTDSCSSAQKALIFSATGDRNAETLLRPLSTIPFTNIYFVIPSAHRVTSTNQDNYSLVEQEELLLRCKNHAQIWHKLSAENIDITVLECVNDALINIRNEGNNPSVLITGSLHLVGAALSILDPNLSE